MRDSKGKFLKGHVSNKPLKERICQMCGKKIMTRMYTQKFCGSSEKKTGCSFKNKKIDKRWGKPWKEKICEVCHISFTPTGHNQKLCGSKKTKYSCSWNRANKKKQDNFVSAPWLRGMTIKIT